MWRTKHLRIALLAVLTLAASGRPLWHVPMQAASFVSYFKATANGDQPLSLWERVTFSLLFAGNLPSGPKSSSPGSESCRS